jgi:hypothetical protein
MFPHIAAMIYPYFLRIQKFDNKLLISTSIVTVSSPYAANMKAIIEKTSTSTVTLAPIF